MIALNNFYFLKNTDAPATSPVTHNVSGDNLIIQIDGDATSFTGKVFGCCDMASDEYYQLTGIATDFSTKDDIGSKGIYTFGIDGISKIKFDLTAISGGAISVFGRITKGG